MGLGTLAAATVIFGTTKIDGSRLNGFRIARAKFAGAIANKTAAEGPLMWGMCANCTINEVKAILEADPQSSVKDDAKGVGQWVKPLGFISLGTTNQDLPRGQPFVDVKVNWSVIEAQSFNMFVFNMGAQLTTGASLLGWLEAQGVWLRD